MTTQDGNGMFRSPEVGNNNNDKMPTIHSDTFSLAAMILNLYFD